MKAIFERGIELMKQEASQDPDQHYVLQPIDRSAAGSRFIQFPSNFQQPE